MSVYEIAYFNNCFIIYLYLRTFSLKKAFVFSRIWQKECFQYTNKLRHNVVYLFSIFDEYVITPTTERI